MLCFHHIGTSQNTLFSTPFGYQNLRKIGFRTEVTKNSSKVRSRSTQWAPICIHVVVPGCPVLPKVHPKSIHTSSHSEVLGPGCPPRLPKASPGSRTSLKFEEIRCKTAARVCEKSRGSDAPQNASSGASQQNPAGKNTMRLL